jgi:hypothetical protein
MDPKLFFAELKRRNVYRVAMVYAIVGWLVVQIASTVLPTFHTQPFPAAPVKWTYQAIYRVGDARVGQWSKPVSVTVGT